MKVWLDDEREEPEGWTRAHTAKEAVELLRTKRVTEISLDHDLGFQDDGETRELTGYHVISWMEWALHEKIIVRPVIHLHTANPVGMARMQQVLSKILAGDDPA